MHLGHCVKIFTPLNFASKKFSASFCHDKFTFRLADGSVVGFSSEKKIEFKRLFKTTDNGELVCDNSDTAGEGGYREE